MKKLILSFLLTVVSVSLFSQTITVNVTEVTQFIHYGNKDYVEVFNNPLDSMQTFDVNTTYVIDTIGKTVNFINSVSNGTDKIKSFSNKNGVLEVIVTTTYEGTNDKLNTKIIIDNNNTVLFTYFNELTNKTYVYSFTKFKITS